MARLKNLKKKTTFAADPPTIIAPPISQVPPQIVDLIVGLVEANLGPSDPLFLGKQKGKEPTGAHLGVSGGKRGRRAQCNSWALEVPKFSAGELDKQVTVADSTQDRETSMALAYAVLLLNDVIALTKETINTIGDFLVIQQV